MAKRRLIKKLPETLQNEQLSKFFNATVDHLFQPESSEKIAGFIGQVPTFNNLLNDHYIVEPTEERAFYQLEPAMVTRNPLNEITESLVYPDLINKLKFQGSDITNHSRLFEQEYYSWAPPVNIDMLVNFTNYFWFPGGPSVITITANTSSQIDIINDIIGKTSYVSPTNINFINGMKIIFSGSNIITGTYLLQQVYIIEGVGQSIILVDTDLLDSNITPLEQDVLDVEYITMGRGAVDNNPWSRTNHWYHKDALTFTDQGNSIIEVTTIPWDTTPWDTDVWDGGTSELLPGFNLDTAAQAKRPIIEFNRDLELYEFGIINRPDVDLVDAINLNGYNDLLGAEMTSSAPFKTTTYTIDGILITAGDRILITADVTTPIKNSQIYVVSEFDTGGGIYEVALTLATDGIAGDGSPTVNEKVFIIAGLTNTAKSYWYNSISWNVSQRKLISNQAPLFNLYDNDKIYLGDELIYPNNNFFGDPIFNYKVGISSGIVDPILGFVVEYKNFVQVAEIIFENSISINIYSYNVDLEDETQIKGFNYAHHINANGLEETYLNGWNKTTALSSQTVTSVNSKNLYTIPSNLQANPDTEEVTELTRSEFLKHFSSIVNNQVMPYRNSIKDSSLGTEILQHQAPLLKTMLLAIEKNLDVTTAIQFSEKEYKRFKNKLIQKAKVFEDQGVEVGLPFRDWLDDIILQFNITKESSPGKFTFAYNRVIASGKNFIEDTFIATSGQTTFSGSNSFDPDDVTKQDILYVYVNNDLKLIDFDYTVSGNIVTLTIPATIGDIIDLHYYENIINTQSFIPATGAVLGITPVYTPTIFVDDTYANARVVIQGHDGSFHFLFGTWAADTGFSEARDSIIWEFEKRVYNTIRNKFIGDRIIYFNNLDVSPSFFRDIKYTVSEFNNIITPIFSRWTIFNKINFRDNTTYDAGNWKTWNFTGTNFVLGGDVFGSWRAIYFYVFDTDRPHTHPWEMLGFSQQPTWWTIEYGLAPYTNINTVMWNDLEEGNIKQGPRIGIDSRYARPGLSNMIPVDNIGALISPHSAGVIINPPTGIQQRAKWIIGDRSPVETAWYRSDTISFILSQLGYLMKPAQFIELNWDTDDNIFGTANSTQLISLTSLDRRQNKELFVHGETINLGLSKAIIFKNGVQQWIANRLQALNKDLNSEFGDKIRSLEVLLGYKGAGFLKGQNLRFIVDTFSPTSTLVTDKTFIQSDDFDLIIYTSPPFKESFYGGVLVEWDGTDYVIFGYDAINPNFNIIPSDTNGQNIAITVADVTVLEYKFGLDTVTKIPYGTKFDSRQEVYDFLISYQRYLETEGWIFDRYDNLTNEIANWRLSGREYLFWSQDALSAGSFITLSPLADNVKYTQEQGFIQNVEEIISGTYSLLDREGFPIYPNNINTTRNDAELQVIPQNDQGIFGLRLNVKEIEHAVFFQNITRFKDTIYIPLLNLRQPRLFVNGKRTTEWNGRLDAPGFIIDLEAANDIIPNFEKTAEDFRNYHSIENPSENDAITDTARHLIGYEKRDYLEALLIDRDVQYEFYQGFIHQKGSPNAFSKLLRSNVISDAEAVIFFEEWGIRIGEYGALDVQPPIELLLRKKEIKSNPQVLVLSKGLISDFKIDNLIKILPNDNRFIARPEDDTDRNFDTRISNTFFPKDLPNAGFPRLGDTDFLNISVDALFDNTKLVFNAAIGKTIWIAKDNNTWNVRILRDTGATIKAIPSIVNTEQTIITVTNNILIDEIINEDSIVVIRNLAGINIDINNTYRLVAGSLTTTSFNINVTTETDSTTDGILLYWDSIRFPNIDLQIATDFSNNEIIYFDNDNLNTGWKVARLNESINDWDIIREEEELIDPGKLKSSLIYDRKINQILTRLTIYDPFKGVIPGIADAEITFKLEQDPAKYTNGPEVEVFNVDLAWGITQVDRLWWDLSSVRYLWYEQGDIGYRYNNWGKLFPGTLIDIYEWVRSPVAPEGWENFITDRRKDKDFDPSGTVKDILIDDGPRWVEREEFDSTSGLLKTFYYFWVQHKDSVPLANFRSISSIDVAKIINNPIAENIPWFASIRTDSVLISNFNKNLSDDNSVLQINFKKTNSDLPIHRQFDLIREGDIRSRIKDRYWNKMRDSLVGFDNLNKEIPDPNLDITLRFGNFYRPRQSWFIDRNEARNIFITKLNKFLLIEPIVESIIGYDNNLNNSETFLFIKTIINGSTLNPIITAGDQMTINSDIISFSGLNSIAGIANEINIQTPDNIVSEIVFTGLDQTIRITDIEGGTLFLNNVTGTPVQDIGFNPTFLIGDAPNYTVTDLTARDALEGTIGPNTKVLVRVDEKRRGLETLWNYTGLTGDNAWELLRVQSYRTADYWIFVDWFAEGYNSSILSNIDRTVASIAERTAIADDIVVGEIIKIENDGTGKFIVTKLQSDGTYLIIVKEDRTIEFKDTLYDLENNSIGFDNQLFDIGLFDDVPNQEFREIMNALRDDILSAEFLLQQNLLFFALVNYVHTEQDVVDWIFKTSFITIQTEGEKISQSTIYTEDKFESFFGYIEEIKPYHTKIRDFGRKLTLEEDTVNAEVTDFDKPPFNDNGIIRILDEDVIDDLLMMKNTKPWLFWSFEYDKGITSDIVRNNNIRKLKTSIRLDRITCINTDYVLKNLKINYEGDNFLLAFAIPDNNSIASIIVKFRGMTATVAKEITLIITADYTISADGLTLTLVNTGQAWIAGTGGLSVQYVLSINFIESIISSPFQPNTTTFLQSQDQYIRQLFVDATAALTSDAFIFPFKPENEKITVTVTGIGEGSNVIIEISNTEDFSDVVTELQTYSINTIEDFDYISDGFRTSPWFRARISPYNSADTINVTINAVYDNNISRILQFYKPSDGMVAKLELINCNFKGTVVDGFNLAFVEGWDSSPWDITGWDANTDDILTFLDVNLTGSSIASYAGNNTTDVYALPPASAAPNFVVYIYTQATAILTLLTAATHYDIVGTDVNLIDNGDPWTGSGDNLAAGFTLIIFDIDYVDNLLATDIITEGNTFLQPQWESNPEELLNLIVKENMIMTVVTSGRQQTSLIDNKNILLTGDTFKFTSIPARFTVTGIVAGDIIDLEGSYTGAFTGEEVVIETFTTDGSITVPDGVLGYLPYTYYRGIITAIAGGGSMILIVELQYSPNIGLFNQVGNGTVGPFALNHNVVATDDVFVTLDGVLQILTTDYTVDVGANTVTFTSGPVDPEIFEFITFNTIHTGTLTNPTTETQVGGADFVLAATPVPTQPGSASIFVFVEGRRLAPAEASYYRADGVQIEFGVINNENGLTEGNVSVWIDDVLQTGGGTDYTYTAGAGTIIDKIIFNVAPALQQRVAIQLLRIDQYRLNGDTVEFSTASVSPTIGGGDEVKVVYFTTSDIGMLPQTKSFAGHSDISNGVYQYEIDQTVEQPAVGHWISVNISGGTEGGERQLVDTDFTIVNGAGWDTTGWDNNIGGWDTHDGAVLKLNTSLTASDLVVVMTFGGNPREDTIIFREFLGYETEIHTFGGLYREFIRISTNFTTTLAVPYNADVDTTITVASGDGNLMFPIDNGVIWIGAQRIEFLTRGLGSDVLSGLAKGTKGSAQGGFFAIGTTVYAGDLFQIVPTIIAQSGAAETIWNDSGIRLQLSTGIEARFLFEEPGIYKGFS